MRLSLAVGAMLGLPMVSMVCPHSALSSSAQATPVLYTVARQYEPLAWMRGGERFPAGASIFIQDQGRKERHPLLRDFAATADPNVSFDGLHVLFAGKQRANGPWQIWEVSVDGSETRRVISTAEDCIRPLYMPDDRVVYARRINGRFAIEIAPLAGGKPLQLTYVPSNAVPTDVLRDGRVLFEASYPMGGEKAEVYTVYPDGSGFESYHCDHGHSRYAGRQITSGDILFADRGLANSGFRGDKLARFTSARAHEVPVAAPAGEYAGDVAETPQGDWLLAWRANSKAGFVLDRWNPAGGALQRIAAVEGMSVVQPVVVAPRIVPLRFPSGLHDWANANLLCLNAYTSKYGFAKDSIHQIRAYTRDANGQTKLLGTAAVEKDGSFFVQVPTERPLQIELLDASGKTLKREAGWFWMRRGEQRVCVGCHAGPETAPENAVPMVLLRSTTPADMTGSTQAAAGGH